MSDRDRGEEAWFRYTRTAGRITAVPTNAKGWIALACAILAPLVAMSLVGPMMMRVHPILFGLALFLAIGVSVFLLVRLVLAKGRSND